MSSFRDLLRPVMQRLRPMRDRAALLLRNRRSWAEVERLRLFDGHWYTSTHDDVGAARADPFIHYMIHGWREGRSPSPRFALRRHLPSLRSLDLQRANPLLQILSLVKGGHVSEIELELLRPRGRMRGGATRGEREDGVLLSGYFNSEIGLGQSARLLAHAMDMARVPLSLRDVPIPDRANERGFETKLSGGARRVGVWVLGMDWAGLRRYPQASVDRRVLYPFWELASVPEEWRAAVREFDAVWAPSSIIANALRSMGIEAPLIRQPVMIPVASDLVPIRAAPAPLSVLTYLDFDSFAARKNVRAAVTAFRAAFPRGHPARMTVKVRGAGGDADRAWLASQVRDDGRIRAIDTTLQWHEVNALVRDCDVFVSLHRSEGFGFGAAEALVQGKAVVSTDYGGTVDFITPETGYPVSCQMIRVQRGQYLGWRGQQWADPSIDHAAELLRRIDRDRAEASAKGRAGRAWMDVHHSPSAVGRAIRDWLAAKWPE